MGDASGGVPVIGEVAARKLIAAFGAIESLYLNLAKPSLYPPGKSAKAQRRRPSSNGAWLFGPGLGASGQN
jgi:hypothetical protein